MVKLAIHWNYLVIFYFSAWLKNIHNGFYTFWYQVYGLNLALNKLNCLIKCFSFEIKFTSMWINRKRTDVNFAWKYLHKLRHHFLFIKHPIRHLWFWFWIFDISPNFNLCNLIETNHFSIRVETTKLLIKCFKSFKNFIENWHKIRIMNIYELL